MNKLPVELALMVGESLRKQEDVLSLMKTSHRFHSLLEPTLFSHPISIRTFAARHLPLVKSLWLCPHLARRVQSLWIHVGQPQASSVRYAPLLYRGRLNEFIEKVTTTLTTADEYRSRATWTKKLRSLCPEAWLAAMVVPLTNLKYLTFGGGAENPYFLQLMQKAALRRRPFHEDPPFRRLEKVVAVRYDCDDEIESHALAPFFYFPAVRSIAGRQIHESPSVEFDTSLVRHASRPVTRIEALEVNECRGLSHWLHACDKLEYVHVEVSGASDEYVPFNGTEFYNTLLPSKRTLKYLHLEYDTLFQVELNIDHDLALEDNLPFGTMKEFTALEVLCVRHAHLQGFVEEIDDDDEEALINKLPSSLRSLMIYDVVDHYYPELLAGLLSVVENTESFPNLETLILCRRDKDTFMARAVKRACEKRGMQFEVRFL
ncbi:hypothetical protein BO70DRAFT_415588 [Aspergillus heteromorphus CBS 117.55]|uniref:F-box domain-containing protein n=1 Tax=Aspergillus heteromorphus CBS 117.55 TaxID=1448321 RepID=A0A317WUS3_9EURO|nr:uncharacterized protein BO70DRAFT_415588 [Aspergillus heteromorphus CBS 117.55]PWY90096.1 hypothetical protein BO70DRAFT_415588 [Aspergillus heteromorphus CBS 117.55]